MSAKIITEDSVTIFHNNVVATTHASDTNWDRVIDALRDDDYDLAVALLDKPKVLREYLEGSGLTVDGNAVFYGKHELPGSLATRILAMHAEGFSISAMEHFVEKLYQNPSYRAIAELYRFLECNQLPISEDGDFMAYKLINNDWTDCFTAKIDNSIGSVPTMPRQEVDDDCTRTCSKGLHFASLEYLKHFTGGGRLVAIKINPADVVSIPVDYNNSKGRCCRYQVVEELPRSLAYGEDDYWATSVVAYGSQPAMH